MNKIFIFLAVFIFLFQSLCFSQWSLVSTQGNTAVSFPSPNTGFSTANGLTRKSTNGGVNWSSLSGGNMTGIFFINDMTGWIVGYPGYIGRTVNGSSFTQQTTGVSDRLNDVFFVNDNTGWVVGGDFSTERIFKTTNAGINWVAQTSNVSNKLFSVHFIDENTGWAVGGPSDSKIIKTTNGGNSWFLQSSPVNVPLYSVMFANMNTGWIVSGTLGSETIIKTTNGGTNWFSQSSGDSRYLRDCYVLDSLRAFAVGQGGKLIATSNGGTNWVVISTGSSVELWSIDFADDLVGYAIGSGAVMKTTNGGLTFVNGASSEMPEEYGLEQNYPNPFNSSTNIKFQIPLCHSCGSRNPFISIKVYDILGKEVRTLVNEALQAGTYSVRFDAGDFPSGIYFYRLTAGDFSETKKLILVK